MVLGNASRWPSSYFHPSEALGELICAVVACKGKSRVGLIADGQFPFSASSRDHPERNNYYGLGALQLSNMDSLKEVSRIPGFCGFQNFFFFCDIYITV